MSPRSSKAEAAATRSKIVDAALAAARIDGFEALSLGRLADTLHMSKAGVVGPFGSKEALQEAVFRAAVVQFDRLVLGRIAGESRGLARLTRLCDAWIDYLAGEAAAHGGCLLTTAASEYDARPGLLRDHVAEASRLWEARLVAEIEGAVAAGDLPAATDAAQLAFELQGIALVTNQMIQLHRDRSAPDRARRAVRRLLG
ncbi:TetR/AcrR family transcriptional regulator [Nonomuraea sp. NPDC048826]|uniref:TetR/AcrR family transcriptional regulator n=1 Tax=Nonomuraea sp. NPDC048826 TaxID=3364347 RepID=UPI0037137D38